jgi:hypothetical protein
MKIAIVCDEKSIFKKEGFRRRLEDGTGCEMVWLDAAKTGVNRLFGQLKELSADILITTDLLGFEQATLTDNLSYNLLDCKQIHLLLHEHLKNESLLKKQLSIAMFFYCMGDTYYQYLSGTYQNLPYLQKITGWKEGTDAACCVDNAEVISGIIRDVIRQCKM